MIVTTVNSIEDRRVIRTLGPVFGEIIEGISFTKDIGAAFTNLLGGRSAGYEDAVIKTRQAAIDEMMVRAQNMGANAVIGLKVDYETIAASSMLMIVASGTAVVVE